MGGRHSMSRICSHLAVTWGAMVGVIAYAQTSPPSSRDLPRDVLAVTQEDGRVTTASTPEQWKPRRQAIVAAMESIMGTLPSGQENADGREPPKVTVLEEVDCGTYQRRRITYQSQADCETSAYLCIPKKLLKSEAPTARAPAILCLHPTDNQVGHDVVVGLGGRPNRQYASELAERGYVTLAPSYPLLAGYQPDLAALGWDSGTLKAVWDNMRGIDLLQSLPYVNPRAIGAIGHSLGGHNAVYTAVFDDRIGAVVSSCGLDSYRDYYGGDPRRWEQGQGWTQLRYMPRLADYHGRLDEIPFDFDEMLAALAPRPVLVIAPLHDSNFRADSVDRVTGEARRVYELFDCPERLRVLHPTVRMIFPRRCGTRPTNCSTRSFRDPFWGATRRPAIAVEQPCVTLASFWTVFVRRPMTIAPDWSTPTGSRNAVRLRGRN